ncbi:hypothetical protein DFH29DRAFT_103353 [Suillus ampliporus]|nr:hypothetical protein DFH29DRAFT_103353 [Suillus ampliporus]
MPSNFRPPRPSMTSAQITYFCLLFLPTLRLAAVIMKKGHHGCTIIHDPDHQPPYHSGIGESRAILRLFACLCGSMVQILRIPDFIL